MREVAFVRKNVDTWKEFEQILNGKTADPDELSDLYLRLTDDLAFAQTYYPDSKTTAYLNELSTGVHQQIYRTKPVDRGRFRRFWLQDVPRAVASAKKEMIVSLIVFLSAIAIGILSSAYDPGFTRLILGDAYVNATLANIQSGDPMAVYKKMHQMDMFLGIALNNIQVSIMAFASGLLFSLGTGYILFTNGVMVGTFHHLFVKHDLLFDSLLVVYIHGTLELSAIVIAGAAGLVLGNGFLFPGTQTRRESFEHDARKGAIILIGLVPVFVVAAFLEGFVTRLTDMPVALSLMIIVSSATAIIGYFVVLPFFVLDDAPSNRNRPGAAASAAASKEDLAPVGAAVSRVHSG